MRCSSTLRRGVCHKLRPPEHAKCLCLFILWLRGASMVVGEHEPSCYACEPVTLVAITISNVPEKMCTRSVGTPPSVLALDVFCSVCLPLAHAVALVVRGIAASRIPRRKGSSKASTHHLAYIGFYYCAVHIASRGQCHGSFMYRVLLFAVYWGPHLSTWRMVFILVHFWLLSLWFCSPSARYLCFIWFIMSFRVSSLPIIFDAPCASASAHITIISCVSLQTNLGSVSHA